MDEVDECMGYLWEGRGLEGGELDCFIRKSPPILPPFFLPPSGDSKKNISCTPFRKFSFHFAIRGFTWFISNHKLTYIHTYTRPKR